jgi:hypothetical protein
MRQPFGPTVIGGLRCSVKAPIGSLDTRVAAHALSQQAILVTNNMREFANVPGLLHDDWVSGGAQRKTGLCPRAAGFWWSEVSSIQ